MGIVKNQNGETKKWPWELMTNSSSSTSFSPPFDELDVEKEDARTRSSALEYDFYDFYGDSCLQAQYSVAPALSRLAFHDCLIEGCDASVLLDATKHMNSKKDAPSNNGLRGFDIIDIIKSGIEGARPAVVCCADIIVLAAKEGVVQAGGLYSFASIGINERETVSLLGGHSIGVVHRKLYYWSLLQGRGILYSDQKLKGREETETWIRAYGSNGGLFHCDFGPAITTKLSNLQVLAGSMDQMPRDADGEDGANGEEWGGGPGEGEDESEDISEDEDEHGDEDENGEENGRGDADVHGSFAIRTYHVPTEVYAHVDTFSKDDIRSGNELLLFLHDLWLRRMGPQFEMELFNPVDPWPGFQVNYLAIMEDESFEAYNGRIQGLRGRPWKDFWARLDLIVFGHWHE